MKDSTTAVIGLVLLCILLLLAPVGVRIYQTWEGWMTAALVLSTAVAIIAGAVGTAGLIGLQAWRFAVRGGHPASPAAPVVIDAHADTVEGEYKHWRVEDVKARAQTRQLELDTARTPFLPAPGWTGQYQDIAAGGADNAAGGRP